MPPVKMEKSLQHSSILQTLLSRWYKLQSRLRNLTLKWLLQIETLPTRSQDAQALQNVLSISTAGKNRYLLHFNNINSLTQWTAGLRLAMFEHATLQEAYTGSLIAGKGKSLNNIRTIMDRTKLKTEEWTRVRFGAGTPWRRCWCVITPPDEKEIQKLQKSLKKKSAYDRTAPVLKGDIKFYDTKKTKKARPIATINDAYSAYAIYPQSKPLIDQSTLVKLEGTITIHSKPETTTEGFVFVMPEVHPAVTGFEMMLRWLFPVYDVFALYGRPNRLIADTSDTRSLMFALPQEKRYGYLEILDVAALIHTPGSHAWNENEWKRQLKELTAQRITKLQPRGSQSESRVGSRRSHRNSLPSRTAALRFEDGASIRSQPSLSNEVGPFAPPQHVGSAPPGNGTFISPKKSLNHQRSVSESVGFSPARQQRTIPDGSSNYQPSRLSYEATPSSEAIAPPPPAHTVPVTAGYRNPQLQRHADYLDGANERSSSESERRLRHPVELEARNIQQDLLPNSPPAPVAAPPAFAHQSGDKPQTRPYHSPELRRANSRMSSTTLSQLAAAGSAGNSSSSAAIAGHSAVTWRSTSPQKDGRQSEEQGERVVNDYSSKSGMTADHDFRYEGMALANTGLINQNDESLSATNNQHQNTPTSSMSAGPPVPSHGLIPPSSSTPRSISPLSNTSEHPTSPASPKNSNIVTRNFSRHSSQHPDEADQRRTPAEIPTDIKAPPIPSEPQRPDYINRSSTGRSIPRKPVPVPSQPYNPPETATSTKRSSLESLRQHAVDEDVLDRIIARPSDYSPIDDERSSMDSSHYDNDSTVSPDYASTRKSTETKRSAVSIDRPRAGVLKTVGTVEPIQKEVVVGETHYRPGYTKPETHAELPNINFGPTQSYASEPLGRLGASATAMQSSHERSGSVGRITPSPRNGSPSASPYSGYGGSSPGPSRVPVTPEPNHYRSVSGGSEAEILRSVAWQPGATIGAGNQGTKQSITPEQFVQQRAAASRVTPIYAHGRKQSSTPPMHSRQSSGDWSIQPRPVSAMREALPRPHSRGPSAGMAPSGDVSAHLSAREQEHVARVTGSPLINMASNARQAPPGGGLIGAIEAREREKKEIKEGLSGQMVQHAIAQRQQHQQASPTPSPQIHIPGQFPQSPGFQTPYGGWGAQQQQYLSNQQFVQQQQQWMSPAAHPAAQIYWNASQSPAAYSQQFPQPQGQYQQGQFQQGQQQYNPYFGNGEGGR